MPDVPSVPNVPATPAVAPATPVAATSTPPVVDSKATPSADKSSDKAQAAKDAKEVKAAIEKIKLGEGEEFTIEELRSMREKAKGADKKFLEANNARKEAMRFFKLAKENPREFLAKTGVDPKKFSYDEVAKDIQDKLRDPREVELEAAQKRLKEFEAKEADALKARQQAKLEQETKAMEARFHAEIIEALESAPSIPKNGFSVAKIAKYIDTVRDKTNILLSAKEVVNVIEQDIRSEIRGTLTGATAEQIIELIGEEGVAAIRKYDLSRLKNPLAGNQGAAGSSDKPKQAKWKNSHDFWKTIDKAAKEERGQ